MLFGLQLLTSEIHVQNCAYSVNILNVLRLWCNIHFILWDLVFFCILRYVIFETVDRIINRMKYQMSYVQEAFSLYIMHSLNYTRYLGISVWKRAIYFWQMYLAVSYYEKVVVQYIVWHDRNQDSLERVLDLYSSTNNYLV